jgi:predicted nuclease of predicted toxin-antitoxin system
MNFLIDAQLPPALCDWLKSRGHDAVHVSKLGLGAASDREIAEHAERAALILVSKDEDFVTLRLPTRFHFLWLRCGNASNSALIHWLEQRWDQIEHWFERGEQFVEAR